MEGQSLTDVKGGSGGGNTNWKNLSDVKTEHLGHGDKVPARWGFFVCFSALTPTLQIWELQTHCDSWVLIFKDELKERC